MGAASPRGSDRFGESSSRSTLVVGCLLTGVALLLQLSGWAPWAQLEASVFDRLVLLRTDAHVASHVVIVDIDENTLSAVGQWPWPRYRMAALVKAIAAARPQSIGLDILFPEPDRTSLATLQESFRQEFGLELHFSGVPPGMEDNDGYLGAVLAGSRAVGAIFFHSDLHDTGPRCPLKPLRISGERRIVVPHQGRGVLCNTSKVHHGLDGFGFINSTTDPDGRLRRLPLLYAYEGEWYPSLSLVLLMRLAGTDAVEVGADVFGPVLKVGRLAIPVDGHGAALLRFQAPGHAHQRISALDILRENYDPQRLKGRTVLVGSSAVGLSDLHRTAVASDLSGAEAHAVLVDGALDGVDYREPSWQAIFVSGTTLAMGVAAAVLFAYLPALQAAFWALVFAVILVGIGLGLFVGAGVTVHFATPVLALAAEAGVMSFLLFRRQERIAEASRRARDAAEAANQAKSEFLARMSHELRTPLHGMLSAAELLLNGAQNSAQKEFAEIIRRSGRTLLAMLNDILDLSKIEAGKFELTISDFELGEIVEAVVQLFGAQAQEKNLALRCDVDLSVPSRLSGDPGGLHQILSNLISNAIKFTAQGKVELRVALEDETPEAATLRFTVSDSGIGIPADRLDRIFAAFEQVDASTTRKYGGTGLGLAITRRLVSLMGGDCGVESEVGQGSRFWFTAVFGNVPGSRPIGKVQAALAGRRLLWVNADAAPCPFITAWLKYWQCRWDVASGPDAALMQVREALAAGDPFPIVLLEMSPGELEHWLGRHREASSGLFPEGTRWIVLTAALDHSRLLQLESLGASACLSEPVTQFRLYACLASAPERVRQPEPAKDDDSSLADDEYRILVADDSPINRKLLIAILAKLGYSADAVCDGQACIEALRERRYDLVLMDCLMPTMDGYEAARLIRAGKTGVPDPGVPIIALTASAIASDQEKCRQAGMDDCLTKPVDIKRLADILERARRDRQSVGGHSPARR